MPLQKMYLALFVLMCANAVQCSDTDYFSSITGLENLLKTEVKLYEEMQNYIDNVLTHVEEIQSELAAIKAEHVTASTDLEGYLNNPVNAYRLIKRLHTDWPTIEESARESMTAAQVGTQQNKQLHKLLEAMSAYRQNLSFPTQNDLFGAAVAMVRLQETYQLDVAQVASGILNGVKYGTAMNWQDCFTMGQHLFAMRDFNHTISWFRQSMELLINEQLQHTEADAISLDFIEVVAGYHQEMGDFDTALALLNYVIAVAPEREDTHAATKRYLEEMLTSGVKTGLMHETAPLHTSYHQTNEFKLYERVCRGEVRLSPSQQRHLHCKYDSRHHPYRLLQPFKVEILYLDPLIVQVHDVIGDREINVVKQLSKPRMTRSQVRSKNGTDDEAAAFRTSKSAWFKYSENRCMQRLRRHVRHFSGLNMKQAEDLQVANYGIGGHYEPHYDFFTDEASYGLAHGNRLATAIFYLSDVEEGGGTAFPFLHVLVKPRKGSILFWYNLHSSEEPDYRTKHAACPVLKGSKWIANIWIRVRNQDRARPCGLQPEGDISIAYKDYD